MVPKSPGLGLGGLEGLGLGLGRLGCFSLGLHISRLTVNMNINAMTTIIIDQGCIFLFGA